MHQAYWTDLMMFNPTGPILASLSRSSILLVILVLGTIILQNLQLNSKLKHLPGPWLSRFSNIRLKIASITGKRMFYFHGLSQKYGPIVRVSPTEILVSNPDDIKTVFASPIFPKAEFYKDIMFTPKVALFSIRDPHEAMERRRWIARPFNKSNIRSHWEPFIRARARRTVARIYEHAIKDGVADMHKWWTLMTNDIGYMLMFGEDPAEVESGRKAKYITDLEYSLMSVSIAREMPLVAAAGKRLPFENVFNIVADVESYGRKAADLAMSSSTPKNVFSGLVSEAGKGNGLDVDDVIAEASNLLIAAADTAASSLTYIAWNVMKRPALRTALEKELATVTPEDCSDVQLEQLPLLNAIIDETLRLYGPANASFPRETPRGGAVFSGYAIPDGVTTHIQAYTLHRNPSIWPNAEDFDPYRFIRGLTQKQRAVYYPFLVGPRVCLGVHVARMELRYAILFLFTSERRLQLAPSCTEASMEMEEFLLTKPRSHRCEVQLEV